ncbi:MAG: hypothetical protein Q8940_22130, partial [Bacteroidota bacterium]|nr:hypothetical protein [Bacteroidota bacterium]
MNRYVLQLMSLLAFFFFFGNSFYAQPHKDPQILQVVSAQDTITLDGKLNETDWLRRFDYLVFGQYAKPGDVEYTVTKGIVVDKPTTDSTYTKVKFLHRGLDLYISLFSNDKSICRRTIGWEGDGMFMKMKDSKGNPQEYKLYWNQAGPGTAIHVENPNLYPNSAVGAGIPYGPVNAYPAQDTGYAAEMIIHLDQLGYTDPYGDIQVLVNIFDPDNYTDTSTVPAQYFKSWWGSEWGVNLGGKDSTEWRILR